MKIDRSTRAFTQFLPNLDQQHQETFVPGTYQGVLDLSEEKESKGEKRTEENEIIPHRPGPDVQSVIFASFCFQFETLITA